MSEKYSDIYESMYHPDANRTLSGLAPEDRLPWQVIEFFYERKGFEWWWGDMDIETRDEIFNALRKLLSADE